MFGMSRTFDRRDILKGLGWLAGIAAATVPRNNTLSAMPAEQLQRTLGYLGYLRPEMVTGFPDELTERALVRFKRHASKPYRIAPQGVPEPDLPPSERFSGEPDPMLTEQTVLEMRRWIERGWKLPLGRFKFECLADDPARASYSLRWSFLREDAAKLWKAAVKEAASRGATLAEPYGDTQRPLGYDRKEGVSRTSFHITGRAVDVNQRFAQGRAQRYYLSPEEHNGRMYFRLYCSTVQQNGSQGVLIESGKVPTWRAGQRSASYLPRGYYVDLTELLETVHFERIPAHEGWEKYDIYSEWWHYQYAVDKQVTFLEECELVGISEKRLLEANYTLDEMDGEPG
jgi:hypothetical protein